LSTASITAAPSAGSSAHSFGDAVVLWGEHHPPLADRVLVALFGATRIDRDDRTPQ
jgi:hypothetical protein